MIFGLGRPADLVDLLAPSQRDQSGDGAALEQLLERYEAPLFQFLAAGKRSVVGEPGDAVTFNNVAVPVHATGVWTGTFGPHGLNS